MRKKKKRYQLDFSRGIVAKKNGRVYGIGRGILENICYNYWGYMKFLLKIQNVNGVYHRIPHSTFLDSSKWYICEISIKLNFHHLYNYFNFLIWIRPPHPHKKDFRISSLKITKSCIIFLSALRDFRGIPFVLLLAELSSSNQPCSRHEANILS